MIAHLSGTWTQYLGILLIFLTWFGVWKTAGVKTTVTVGISIIIIIGVLFTKGLW